MVRSSLLIVAMLVALCATDIKHLLSRKRKSASKDKKIVFHCCTVYQLIVAIQVKCVFYSSYWSELIISKSTPNSNIIAKRLCGVFDSVVVADNETLDWNAPKMMSWYYIKKRLPKLLESSNIKENDVVDEYLFAGLGGFSNAIGQWLMHEHGCKNIAMFEEGASSYSRIYEHAICMRRKNPSIIKNLYYKCFPHVLSVFKKFYFFDPNLCLWDTQSKVIEIPSLLETKSIINPILNKVFSVKECRDSYDRDVIFFEESYYNDGILTGDVELVENLAKIYGKDNIIVKVHPRNKENRFKKLGYTTNVDLTIPWEAIALNIEGMENKTLVTMTSTALISTYLCIKSNAKLIFYTSKLNSQNQRVLYTAEVIKKLASLYPNIIEEI